MAVDATAWPIGMVVAVWARFEFTLTPASLYGATLIAAFAATVQLTVAQALQLVHGRHGYGAFEDSGVPHSLPQASSWTVGSKKVLFIRVDFF